MKKLFYTTLFAVLFFLILPQQSHAATCSDTVSINSSLWDQTTTITPDMLLDGDQSLVVVDTYSPQTLDCGDYGLLPYTISGTDNGVPFTCSGVIDYLDDAPPIAICDLDVMVFFPLGQSSLTLDPLLIDNGSWDLCGEVTLELSPSVITDDQVNSVVTVTLTVTDQFGNYNQCWTNVIVTGGNPILACNADVLIVVPGSESVQVTPQMVLAGDYDYSTLTIVVTDVNGDVVPGSIIDNSYVGQQLTYEVTDLLTGATCWAYLDVVAIADNIQWPIDIDVTTVNILPASLINVNGLSEDMVYPQYGGTNDPYTFTYTDILASLNFNQSIINREWTASIDGNAVASHTQIIRVNVMGIELNVNVQTTGLKPLADVLVNAAQFTDQLGKATSDQYPVTLESADNNVQGINVRDIYVARKHILNIETLSDWEVLAADVTVNNALTTLDLVYITRDILRVQSLDKQWYFHENVVSATLPNPSASYIGYQLGDAVQEDICPAYNTESTADLVFSIEDKQVELGSTDCIKVFANGFYDIASYQLQIKYDATVIKISTWKNLLDGEIDLAGNANNSGTFVMIGLDSGSNGVSVDKCTPIVELCFETTGELGGSTSIDLFASGNFINEVTYNNGNVVDIDYIPGSVKIGTETVTYNKPYPFGTPDVLLNKGETYTIPLFLPTYMESCAGVELHFDLDPFIINNLELTSDYLTSGLEWHIDDDNQMHVLMMATNVYDLFESGGLLGSALLSLTFTAQENGLLKNALKESSSLESYILDNSGSMYEIGFTISDQFTSKTTEISVEHSAIAVYPNPCAEVLNIAVLDQALQIENIILTDVTGRILLNQKGNVTTIEVGHFETGLYFVLCKSGDKQYLNKFYKN